MIPGEQTRQTTGQQVRERGVVAEIERKGAGVNEKLEFRENDDEAVRTPKHQLLVQQVHNYFESSGRQ